MIFGRVYSLSFPFRFSSFIFDRSLLGEERRYGRRRLLLLDALNSSSSCLTNCVQQRRINVNKNHRQTSNKPMNPHDGDTFPLDWIR